MDLCWRWPPMIALVAVLGHATSWFGASAPNRSGTNPIAELGGVLSGADSMVSQIVAWFVVLLAFELLCCIGMYLIGEYKLRRLYDRPARRWGRSQAPMPPQSKLQFPAQFPTTQFSRPQFPGPFPGSESRPPL